MQIFIENEFNQDIIWNLVSTSQNLLEIIDDTTGFNLLHAAAYYALEDLFLKIIAATEGAGLSSSDKKGRTPIHHLASNGRTSLLQTLLTNYPNDIDLLQTNTKGRTALHIAAKHLHLDTVQLLVEAGQNKNLCDICDKDQNTALSLTYHRHYPGPGIKYNNPVYDYLLNVTRYWQLQAIQYNDVQFNQDEDILTSWLLGLKFSNNPNWLPEIKIPLRNKEYIVKNVYQTEISKFVVLQHNENNILLCLDKVDTSKKNICIYHHVSSAYLNTLQGQILEIILKENDQFTQVWGIELAGIDAQLLASHILLNPEKEQKLILINSPGLPVNLSIDDQNKPTHCKYIFSAEDALHLKGQYAWKNGANFYSFNKQNVIATSDIIPPYKKELQKLRQRKLNLSINAISSIAPTEYVTGIAYNAEINTIENEQQSLKSAAEELFEVKNQYLKNANPALINFARFEYCAHGIGYLHLPNDHQVQWWDINALMQKRIEPHNVQLKRIIHHQGLYCYLLQHNQEMTIMFQGTDPSDSTSIRRDLDRSGAGTKRIRHQYIDIIKSISFELEQNNNNDMKLFICGHSLGGADAQNFFTSLIAYYARSKSADILTNNHWMKFLARNKPQYNLEKIKEIHLYAYNGAGIRNSSAKLAKAAASKLPDNITITINHQRVNQDIVNLVGDTMLHDFDTTKIGVRNLFFSGREQFAERIATAHTETQFVGENIGAHELLEGSAGKDSLNGLKLEPTDSDAYNIVKQILNTGNFA